MRLWTARTLLIAGLALVLAASLTPKNYAQGRPIVIAITGDAETMDPILAAISTTGSVQRHMLEPMVDNDTDGKLVSVLATSWRALDTLTWEFKLRPNVRFHNGDPFNAAAAKFSIERARDHARSLQKAYVSLIKDVRAVDDLTLHLTLTESSPDLVANIAAIQMLSPRYAREAGDEGLNRRPIGTGPYRFV